MLAGRKPSVNIKGTKVVRAANVKPTKAGVSDVRTQLGRTWGHFKTACVKCSRCEMESCPGTWSLNPVTCLDATEQPWKVCHFAMGERRFVQHISFGCALSVEFPFFAGTRNSCAMASGDEENGSKPEPRSEPKKESVAFNEELDDLAYLKMKATGRESARLAFSGLLLFQPCFPLNAGQDEPKHRHTRSCCRCRVAKEARKGQEAPPGQQTTYTRTNYVQVSPFFEGSARLFVAMPPF